MKGYGNAHLLLIELLIQALYIVIFFLKNTTMYLNLSDVYHYVFRWLAQGVSLVCVYYFAMPKNDCLYCPPILKIGAIL